MKGCVRKLVACAAILACWSPGTVSAGEDTSLLPEVPDGFVAELYARDPLIRHPAGMCFDSRGRLFVGQGPQFRSPRSTTRGDTIEILIDRDGDGIADSAKTFASGFNCIQGLVWRGKDLWVANAPDFNIVRDLDGDDVADEYVLVWTDLGNLEHGLHGLNWAPDGKLYMSKGNSKGYSKDRFAPKPFRVMWDAPYPADAPDHPPIQVFKKGEYKKSYHNPRDDWGRTGGIFRCDDLGRNPELISLGLRNPWDMTFDEGFNFIGTDNDQDGGDKIFMPFFGAHFGWGHPWSYDWRGADHPPTVEASGPFQIGSGTGTKFYASTQLPENYRNVFFLNDWLSGTTFVHRPRWDGALIRNEAEEMEVFARSGDGSLYKPTDMEVGPDGALYIGGWSEGYGVQWKDGVENGEMTNEGRVFRISHKDFGLRPRSAWDTPKRKRPYSSWSFAELVEDFDGASLPVWRVDAQDELVRRGAEILDPVLAGLSVPSISMGQETYLAWTLGRIELDDPRIDRALGEWVGSADVSTNLRVQALRILAYRIRRAPDGARLPATITVALRDPEARIRFEAVQAIWQARQGHLVDELGQLVANETDDLTNYCAWNTLRELGSVGARRKLLGHANANVRFAALMSFLGTPDIAYDELIAIVEDDPDARMQEWALRWVLTGSPGPILERRPSKQRGMKDLPAVVQMIRERSDKPIRKFLIDLLPEVEGYDDVAWRDLQRLYRDFKKGVEPPLTQAEHVAILEAFSHHIRSTDLLWSELMNEDRVLREAAIDGLVTLGEPGRAFVASRLDANGDKLQQSGAIEALRRFDPVRNPWAPPGGAVRALGEIFEASDDPTLRSAVAELLLAADWTLVEVSRAVAQKAAQDSDPRVYNLAAPLAAKLGATIALGEKPKAVTAAEVAPLVAAADPANGRAVFLDEKRTNCVGCHQADGVGGQFAPPLSDAGLRLTREQLLESILQPSVRITEGYQASTIVTRQGQALTGVVRKETDNSLEIFLADARSVQVDKKDVALRQVSDESIMPPNLGEILRASEVADLVAWLMTLKKKPTDPQAGN